jgi:hypothetical protein
MTKPTYLGLLNAIAVGEGRAEEYLNCWADVTPNDDVRRVLRTIALREGEHAKAFAKRICELGYDLRVGETGEADERAMAVAASTTLSDREKFEALRLGQEPGDGPDVFARMFDNRDIDIQTGALLGRYIAEERDSGRRFRDCYRQLCNDEHDARAGDDAIVELTARLDRIEAAVDRIASAVAASAPASTNGRSGSRSNSTSTSKKSKSGSR